VYIFMPLVNEKVTPAAGRAVTGAGTTSANEPTPVGAAWA
jgi:hypothetical protein